MINCIAKITVYVNNQEEAKEFWTEKMGFAVRNEYPMGPGMKWLEVAPADDNNTTFILYEKEMMKKQNPAANTSHPSIILSTMDIDKAHETMKEKEIEVTSIRKMPYGSMFTFHDQDGNAYLVRED